MTDTETLKLKIAEKFAQINAVVAEDNEREVRNGGKGIEVVTIYVDAYMAGECPIPSRSYSMTVRPLD